MFMCSHLWDVIRFRNIDTLRTLLELGEDINFRNPNFSDGTLLEFAIERGWFEIADFLIDQGADVNAPYDEGRTLIYLAIFKNNLELVKRLVEHGATLQTNSHWQPLHEAVYAQSFEIVQFLFNSGAEIDAVNASDRTALEIALTRTNREIIDFLLSHGAAKSIHVAAAIGDLQTVEQYLKTGGDPNLRSGNGAGCSPIYVAAIHNQLEVAELLIRFGADIDLWCEQDTHTIVEACHYSSLEMVKLLLENGARTDLSNLGGGLLTNAAYGGRIDIAQLLILKYDLPAKEESPYQGSPVLAAISCGQTEMLEFLLSQGASIPENATFCAAQAGHHQMVRFLSDRGVDPNVRSLGADTALERVANLGDAAMVRTLLSIGVDVNTKNDRGWTALHWAAVCGHVEIVQLLVSAGADVNAGLERGDTPLQVAGLWRYDEIVEFLIKNGAKG